MAPRFYIYLSLFQSMDGFGRLLFNICVDKEAYAEKDEWDAQQLSHIQDHIILKCYLRFLNEFYKEAHAETYDEEYADECTPVDFVELEFVQIHEAYSEY